MQNQAKTTIDPEEIERFSRIADEWWNPRGKFAPLHAINPLRVEYIKKKVQDSGFRIQGLSLLDVGCGGGLLCEPFARLGAHVTGIDASEKNIAVAKLHSKKSGLDIDYQCTTAEALRGNEAVEWRSGGVNSPVPNPTTPPPQFDLVLALEIVEHVADLALFVQSAAALVKPGGLLMMSTLNRTAKSYALAIIGAEYVLRWLPIGTHTWSKFVKPHELVRALNKNSVDIVNMQGMVMNPLTFAWRWDANDLSVNYIITGKKAA